MVQKELPSLKKILLNPYLILAIPFVIIFAANFFIPGKPIKDEILFFPIIKEFGVRYLPTLDQIKHIQSPMGPVYFIFWGFIGKLFGFSLPVMRGINIAIGYIIAVIIYTILKYGSEKNIFLVFLTTWFVANPYFLALTTPLLYTENLSLLFLFFGAYFYLIKENRVIGGLLWGASICTRQVLIIFPLAGLLTDMIILKRKSLKQPGKIIQDCIPFIMFGVLFVLWGVNVTSGMQKPGMYEENTLKAFRFSFKTVHYSLLLFGIYSFPLWVTRLKDFLKPRFLIP